MYGFEPFRIVSVVSSYQSCPTKSAREPQSVTPSSVHLGASNQKQPVSRQGVISVIGRAGSPAQNPDYVVPSRSSATQDCRTNSASPDDDLISICQQFRSKIREWIEQVEKLGIESYYENEETGRALHALRVEWGNCLEILRALEPSTVDGANEKLSAAQVFLTFSCEADGSAAELLALATRELDHVTANLRVSDRAQISRPVNTQGPRGWFERLTRRA